MALIEYDFAVVATSAVDIDEKSICELADRLFGAGAEDCTISSRGNALIIEFDREAESYEQAVISAIKQVELIDTLTVISVDAGQYVGLSDAAELSNLTRSALSKFSTGERGDGSFPTPYLRLKTKAPLYDWSEIARWLEQRGHIEHSIAMNARITANINLALKLRSGELKDIYRLVSVLN